MDIGDTIAPDSDQLDAIDLKSSGPRTFTVTRVVVKAGDQPVDIHLAEFPRPWRPGKSMRRVLDGLWGPSAGGAYEGRRVTLYCDPRVKFGGDAVGGVRISHMSHIGGKKGAVPLIVSRGQVRVYTVDPLPDDRAATAAPQQNARITPEHEAIITAQMERTGAKALDVLAYAREVTGRPVRKSRELSAAEADAVIERLTALPDENPAE